MNSLCSFICRNLYFVFNSEGYFLLYMEFWVGGLFFFQCYEEIFWLLTVIVSRNTPAINYFVVFCIKCHCPSDTFKTFFLFSYLLSSESWCDFFFLFFQLWVYESFLSSILFSPRFEEILPIIQMPILLHSLFSAFGTPITHILDHFILFHIGLRLRSFVLIFYLFLYIFSDWINIIAL